MNREQLGYFASLYHIKSIAAAAKRIPMSPQGFAKAIHTLERELDVPLFQKGKDAQKTPTRYADALIRYFEDTENSYERLRAELAEIKAREKKVIRVGFAAGTLGRFGPEFIPQFIKEYPGVSIAAEEMVDTRCDDELLKGSLDMAFTKDPYDTRFVTSEILVSGVNFWVRKDNRLSRKESLSVRDLQGQVLGLPGKGYKITDTILSVCERERIVLKETYLNAEMYCIYGFVSEGKGIGFATDYHKLLPIFNQDHDIVCIPAESLCLHVGLSYLPNHLLTPHEKAFYQYCITKDFPY
ncbi:MAG: LysR family transcriptional regulator [Coriobacteriales bacterium]|nr:LysR family transcriptional regulator [Coriobacteriales bacterium]